MTNKADLILHPIRMRILMALVSKQKTSKQLAAILPDIPPATLYRHIRCLAKAGLINIVAERPVRGAVEKVYTVDPSSATLTADEMASASKEDHLRYFTAFVASLLDDFSHFLERTRTMNLTDEGVGYNKVPLELSDEELKSLSAHLNQVFGPYLANTPRPDRRRRIITSIVMPDLNEIDISSL